MMLRALYELAQREGLLADPDFEQRAVHYLIVVGPKGEFRSLIPRLDERGRPAAFLAPRTAHHTNRVEAGFLLDNAKYVLGLGNADGEHPERDEECAEAFAAEAARVAEVTKDDGAIAVDAFLRRREVHLPAILQARPRNEWAGNELITFALDSDGTAPVFGRVPVVAEWRSLRGRQAGDANLGRCLVMGVDAPIARTHGTIRNVPEAQSSGAPLVSFDKPAFRSFGLDQGDNAPVSRAAAEGYVTGLNWLLQRTPERSHRYGLRVADDTVMVFWTRHHDPLADVLLSFFDPTENDLKKMLESPFTGVPARDVDANAFYAATIAGNAARVVVRDWFSSTVGEVKANVRSYFEDLHIGNGAMAPVPMRWLMEALKSPGGIGLSPNLSTRLLRAALHGSPFPRELIGTALRRLRLPPKEDEQPSVLRLRCSLIKATLLRMHRSGLSPMEVTVSLDEKNNAVPYLLGRLFAVLERLQAVAIPGINATIRDRYFGAAMAHPAAVFPRLLVLSNHHASKAEKGGWLERIMGQVIAALPAHKFPTVLSLEDQGLFAIGYFHQRERFFEKRAATTAQPVA
jgi:CRISPR-associated protein Csd1